MFWKSVQGSVLTFFSLSPGSKEAMGFRRAGMWIVERAQDLQSLLKARRKTHSNGFDSPGMVDGGMMPCIAGLFADL